MTTFPLMSEAVTVPFIQPVKLTRGMGLPSSAACSARTSGLSSHVQSSGNSPAKTGQPEHNNVMAGSRDMPVLTARLSSDLFMRVKLFVFVSVNVANKTSCWGIHPICPGESNLTFML
jgi:hypothetical protein